MNRAHIGIVEHEDEVTVTLDMDRLTTDEQLELIEIVWDSITDSESAPPVPDWHREELTRRIAAADSNPGAGRPWVEVREALRRRQ